ncbi:MAG: hypothetical protein WAX44_01280, partial [Minisyncoccia bacterium]
KRAERLSARSARWSGRYGVTEFIVTSPLTFWKKVRAKDRISPQTETSWSESPKLPRADGAENGERMESAFCFWANSEGGQGAGNEILIV